MLQLSPLGNRLLGICDGYSQRRGHASRNLSMKQQVSSGPFHIAIRNLHHTPLQSRHASLETTLPSATVEKHADMRNFPRRRPRLQSDQSWSKAMHWGKPIELLDRDLPRHHNRAVCLLLTYTLFMICSGMVFAARLGHGGCHRRMPLADAVPVVAPPADVMVAEEPLPMSGRLPPNALALLSLHAIL